MKCKIMTRFIGNLIGNLTRGQAPCEVRLAVTLLLMMVGVLGTWGQEFDPYEGIWYIQNNATGYYMCPTIYGNYNDNDETPYVTTYQSNKDNYSLWRIEKAEVDGDNIYYHFIHQVSGKYLTANDAVDEANPGRQRLHLETIETPGDATLFLIKPNSSTGRIAIRPKSAYATNAYWLTVSNGNKGNYWNGDYQGTIGLADALESAALNTIARWHLDPVTCATPIISYNESEGTFSLGYPLDDATGVTFYYTTDGTTPTTGSTPYTAPFSNNNYTIIKAIAVKDGISSAVVELYAPHNYLFKTSDAANKSFYLLPPLDDTYLYVTTSNVPNEKMVWQLRPASYDGIQSYYIVNQATGEYLYYSGNMNLGNAFVMNPLGAAGTEDIRYKYCLFKGSTEDYEYFNITARKFAHKLPKDENNSLYKQNASDHTNPTGLYKDNTNGLPRWQAIEVPSDPKTLFDNSFVAEDGKVSYWKIQSVGGTTYYVTNPTTAAYATATTDGTNITWFFEKAREDTWNTYYYIRNAETGSYLYYDADRETNHKFFTIGSVSSASSEACQFVIVRTASTNANSHDSYNIIPKAVKDTPNQANISMNRASNTNLRLGNSRNNSNGQWNLVATDFRCQSPTVNYTISGGNYVLTITSPTPGAKIYYTTDGTDPDLTNSESTHVLYDGPVTVSSSVSTVKMIAARSADGTDQSDVATFEKPALISKTSDIISPTGTYVLDEDFTDDLDAPVSFTSSEPFQGTIDGQFCQFELKHPLFDKVENAIIKNVIISTVKIDESGNVGTICNEAAGATRIYNCGILSGSVSGSDKVGGLVGLLDGTSRVINCYSYADITGGADKGGIVGYNNQTSTNASLTTMVMNCMFYGDIAEGGNISPIYGGTAIDNVNDGLPNYNYYRFNSPYSKNDNVNKYNRALAMEEKFINRFERYRLLLNSNRPMAAFYATGAVSDADSKMAKWVLETADRTIEQPMPYPVLKPQGKYPSIINFDAANAPDSASVGRNHGGQIGTPLRVTISGIGSDAPLGASLTDADGHRVSSRELTLIRTDKDFDRFNYNYNKVQLPYYNDVGTGNYTSNKVVTGWKIIGFTGGTAGTYNAADEWGGFNFADRDCTNKDFYGEGGSFRVFSQGAYFDVPNGVTAITIEPYWGKAAYVCDQYYDVNFSSGYSAGNVKVAGVQHDNNTGIDIYGDGGIQKVYTSIENARNSMNIPESGKTVYDYAVVLVGNVHQSGNPTGANTPYTIMSIDLNHDNEPDYSYIFGHNNRQPISPIRFDFLNIVGIAEAQMPNGASAFRNVSIFNIKGWFEITNTCIVNFSQFEYDNSNGAANAAGKSSAPLILQGGTFEQFVSTQKATNLNEKHTQYIHIGSNVWFAKFGNGTHSDGSSFTPHIPVSVTGGDYDEFYLSGTYQPTITNMSSDNAECYVSGGHFGEMAAGSLEPIQGDVRWDINWADITNFYGGGTNAKNPITGDIQVDIANSHVNLFCGGPKFGDMSINKTVTTNATGCTFGSFFGAGYGGNSYNRVKYTDKENGNPYDVQNNYADESGIYYDGKTTNSGTYGKKGEGVATDFDYEFFVWSNGSPGGRFYVKFVSFSLATTRNVTSNLERCIITGNFYGGASYGKVDGDATSLLNNCKVEGSVFGAGYSATLPTIPVRKTPAFVGKPSINKDIGMFEMGEINGTEEYLWKQVAKSELKNKTVAMESTTEGNFVWTAEDLTALGTVSGNVTLNILGDETEIKGDVYGGGALASSNTDCYTKANATDANYINTNAITTVNLLGGKVMGDVYGGGMGRLAKAAVPVEGKEGEEGYKPGVPAVEAVEALVGNTKVNLNGVDNSENSASYASWGLVKDDTGTDNSYIVNSAKKGCVVEGNIFGCNNINGTPKGTATVHVFATQNANAATIANPADGEKTAKVSGRYDVAAVYGGGNLAAYEPNATLTDGTDDQKEASKPSATVIVDGCDLTSIRQVYGGGNAASTPATKVTVNGTYEIEEVFGGGNGKDKIDKGQGLITNPGANVGFKDYWDYEKEKDMDAYDTKDKRQTNTTFQDDYVYGSGKASVNIYGGKIHRVFGGSNTRGNVRITAVTMLDNRTDCDFQLDEAYGGGKSASMDAEARLLMACVPGLKEVYGGAEEADIQGDVTLSITNGTFDRVFGGNNISGTIGGSISVNIEETGCKPIIIGELYGGGNEAPYSIYGYDTDEDGKLVLKEEGENPNNSPVVNVKSFTSIGDIYGGGYGGTAVMVGNPTVNVSVAEGKYYDNDISELGDNAATNGGFPVPSHAKGKIGAINNVFGGGNAAKVIGDTNINIGTLDKVTVKSFMVDSANNPVYDEDGYQETEEVEKTVIGADIRGNVYGGGNNAQVTGNANVKIGKEVNTTPSPAP